jgi:hypothetical protein
MRTRRANVREGFGQSPPAGFPGGFRQIYGLALLLLVMVFFALMFRGRTPRVLERVFATPPAVDDGMLAARHDDVATRLEGAWQDPADGAPFAETPGYARILRKLTDHVRPGDMPADPPLFDRALAVRAPELQRSEIVKVRGIVAGHWAQKLEHPVFQLTDVWRVFLADNDGEDGIVVDVVERPPALTEHRDTVEFTGHFYRLVGYETQKGQHVEIPYLMARSLTIVADAPAASPFDEPAMLVVVVGIGAMALWGVVRVVQSRPRPRGVRWRAPHLG